MLDLKTHATVLRSLADRVECCQRTLEAGGMRAAKAELGAVGMILSGQAESIARHAEEWGFPRRVREAPAFSRPSAYPVTCHQ